MRKARQDRTFTVLESFFNYLSFCFSNKGLSRPDKNEGFQSIYKFLGTTLSNHSTFDRNQYDLC